MSLHVSSLRRAAKSLIFTSVLFVGCSSSGEPSSVPSSLVAPTGDRAIEVESIPLQRSADPFVLERYKLQPEQEVFVYETYQDGMSKCMAELGFTYLAARFDKSSLSLPEMAVSLDDVQRYGYNVIPAEGDTGPDPAASQVPSDDAYTAALFGDSQSSQGCQGKAYAAAYVAHPYWTLNDQLEAARANAFLAAEAMPEYAKILSDWSACMASQGFVYQKPEDPISQYAGTDVDSTQILTRITDLKCQAEVSLEWSIGQLVNRAQTEWLEANAGIVADFEAVRSDLIDSLTAYRSELGI